jgi:UDP-N-acetylglucosamine--N-acetylmuramyl-(pentapeptide) pyrophosphoryl-undecaprenol N-acetylglucosamine transferase
VDEKTPVLLVLGGSLGARQLNALVRENLRPLTALFFVAHQYGGGNEAEIPESGRDRAWPFIREELPHVIAAAAIVLCRAGAGTIQECAVLGKPMVLVPLSGPGTRGDQVENARRFEKAGAALVLDGDAAAGNIGAVLESLFRDAARREDMGKAALAFAGGDAAETIAMAIAEEAGVHALHFN